MKFFILILFCFVCIKFSCSKITIYTNDDRNQNNLLTSNSNDLNSTNPTVVIIPQLLAAMPFTTYDWTSKLKDSFFINGSFNVIMYDYEGNSNFLSCLDQNSDACLESQSQELANTLANLINTNKLKEDTIHFIGFSKGAHIAAKASNLIKGKTNNQLIGRITGMAPDQACYGKSIFNPTANLDKCLSHKHAKFVDIIHTVPSLVEEDSVGHVDYFVDNTKTAQPACQQLSKIFDTFCNHKMAYEYFTESLAPSNQFVARKCNSWDEYSQSNCISEERTLMGFPTSSPPKNTTGKFYLKVNKETPYAQGGYMPKEENSETTTAEASASDGAQESTTQGSSTQESSSQDSSTQESSSQDSSTQESSSQDSSTQTSSSSPDSG